MDLKTTYRTIVWGIGNENSEKIPKIIWTFWDAPTSSPLVDLCFEKINAILPDYELHIITSANIHTYLENFCLPRTDISFINYTDIVRLKLMEKYGGFYTDASILCTENFDWLHHIKATVKPDFIGFYSDKFTANLDFPLIETWFYAAPPNNRFIVAWAAEFEKCYQSPNPHRYFDEEKKQTDFLQNIDEPLSNYLISYLAASKVMRNNPNYRIYLISSNDTAHFFNFTLNLKPHQLAALFLLKKNNKPVPKIIKFEKRGRNAIDLMINRGQYSKKSLLFRIAEEKNYYWKKIPRLMNYIPFIIQNLKKKYLS